MKPGLEECENAVIVPHIASATLWTRAGMVGALCCAWGSHCLLRVTKVIQGNLLKSLRLVVLEIVGGEGRHRFLPPPHVPPLPAPPAATQPSPPPPCPPI